MTGWDVGSDWAASDRAMRSQSVRATSAMPRAGVAMGTSQSAFITAELPIAAPRGLERPRAASSTRSARRRRDPAPIALRLVVWFLFFCLLAAAGGSAVLVYHPAWFAFLRATANPRAVAASVSHGAAHMALAAGSMRLASSTAQAVTYLVPVGAYRLVIATAEPCWTTVTSPAGSRHLVFAETLLPGGGPASVSLSGSSSLMLDAVASSVEVSSPSSASPTPSSRTPSHRRPPRRPYFHSPRRAAAPDGPGARS